MKYIFHPEALTEYAEAVRYYADRRVERGQAFIDAIEEAIFRIRESPTRWRITDGEVHQCLVKKFPYGILYTIEPDYIIVLAVMHCSREPGYWKKRDSSEQN